MHDPATVKDWLTVIGTVLLMPTSIIGASLLLNFTLDHWAAWCAIRWQRLVRYAMWLACNLPVANSDADWWLTPPPIPPTRQRR